ncbi:hypothetical protein BJV82DRAFT_560738 [Fennellomyces sp. T-0311]|nr:hypothetical protein BJV82DRAFT_560738 [Fennellomyces sp. T-0311]
MPATTRDNRRLTGYADQQQQQRNRLHPQSLYDDGMDDYDAYRAGDDYDDDDDTDEEEESVGSVLSIPDPNIDFDLVYALHTFAATVEGQASVVKGDALTLLDDSNSYWWLVKVLKTSEIGYIPAENIETPYERLARLNSHRNIELTQRDIQDAFPAPPSTKAPSNKKVKLAKGVKFQAQVIFGASDDEDFEEEYEEWQETIRTDSDTDDDTTDTDDDEDDDDYYDDVKLYTSSGYGQSPVDNYTRSQQQQMWSTSPQQQAQVQNPQQYQYQQAMQQQQQQQQGPSIQQHSQSQQQQQQPASGLRNFDLEPSETIKYSLTPAIARTSTDFNNYGSYRDDNKQSKASKLESILAADENTNIQEQQRGSKEKEKKGGLRKLFSRNTKDGKDKKQRKGSTDKQSVNDSIETASFSSQSTGHSGHSERERINSVDSSSQQRGDVLEAPAQPAILKIFAGNVRFGAEYKIAHAYPSTTAAELIQQALHRFDIENYQANNVDAHLDYFLIIKGVDGDEYTLVPMDKPLAIYHSLMGHLSVPMPSLKKARRISALMGGVNDSTHIGGPKEKQEDIEEARFYLYTKAKRPEDGNISIKVSLFASEIGGQTSILKFDQARVDKLVTVPINASVGDVTGLLLDKFHILNGVVDGPDVEDKIKALRLQGANDGDAVKYRLSLNKQGHEFVLVPNVPIKTAFGENLPPIHHRRSSSNPDRSSIASLSSVITQTPQPDETYFILRRSDRPERPERHDRAVASSHQPQQPQAPTRPVRPPRPVRQDTPMPQGGATPSPIPTEVPTMHPLTISQQQQESQIFDEPESAVDVLMKLDQALDNLAHTRNSNDMLTEAIVSSRSEEDSAAQSRSVSRQDASRQEMNRPEIGKVEVTRVDRQDAGSRQGADSRQEAARQEAMRQEAARQEAARQEAARQEAARQEAARQEAARQEAVRQEAARQEAARQEAIRQEAIRQEASSRQELSSRQDTRRQETPKPQIADDDDDDDVPLRTRKNGSIVESLLFCEEFGMNELMVLIRGAVRYSEEHEHTETGGRSKQPPIRSEISEVFKDTYSRLDQLEKELDLLMADAVKMY